MSNNNTLFGSFPSPDEPGADSAAALSISFAIASAGIAMLKMLETLLPAAASEVERESQVMASHFTTLVDHLGQDKALPEPVREAISGIIMSIQFQDRNTQVMDNVASMLERYRIMLEDVCNNIEVMRDDTHAHGTMTHAVENILSSIRMSDIRTRYMEALTKAKGHASTETTDHPERALASDIELF